MYFGVLNFVLEKTEAKNNYLCRRNQIEPL